MKKYSNKEPIIKVRDKFFEVYIQNHTIQERITHLAHQIRPLYQDKRPILIGVLNGCFMFMCDLIKHLDFPCEIDFIKLSSYGDKAVSSGNVSELKAIQANLEKRHIILIEDIIDSGLTLKFLRKKIEEFNPLSCFVVSLFLKKSKSNSFPTVVPDLYGFLCPHFFIIGYGLDYAQEARNLPHIYKEITK